MLLAFLGRSWGDLGSVFGRLGPSWGGLGAVLGGLRSVMERSLAVLGRLEAVLERSWAVLGRLGGVWGRLGELKTLISQWFFNTFCKIDVLSKHCYLGRSWAFLRTAWADLGPS